MSSKRNSSIRCRAVIVALGISCAVTASAAVRTNTLVNGASNWNDPHSYTDTSFVPGPDDVVIIPENATVYLNSSDTASFNIMSNLSYLCFTHTNSVLEITVPEGGDALFDCSFKGLWEPKSNGQYYSGLIVKKGKGCITAGDGSKYPAGRINLRRQMPVRIDEGTWRCAQNIPAETTYEEMSRVHIAEGAFFCLSSSANPAFYNQITCLTGKGTVTAPDSTKHQLRIIDQQYGGVSRFEGVFDEGVYYFSSARVLLEGTNSIMSYSPAVFGGYASYATNTGYTAVMKFGMAGEPSSIGTNGVVEINSRGGGWGYLGAGETTDKIFTWYPHYDNGSYVSLLLDGGAYGGLVFSGQWKPSRVGLGYIVLAGSNTTSACVVDCPIQYNANDNNSTYDRYAVSVAKTGTGIWRFKHNPNRHMLGVIDIQQGTLQADSLEEAGVQSSLGYSTNNFIEGYANNATELPANKRAEDYSFVMGAEASDSIAGVATEGTFEYTGTNSAYCFTRPYVLDGDARFKNSTPHRFWTGKVRSRSAGAKTLTLDGDGANTNLLADISDVGGGAISLAKEGTGTWIVSGTNDIRGDIAVKAGTLILQNINGQPYTWHKWQIRSNYAASRIPADHTVKIRPCEFGLFGADGVRVNSNLSYCDEYQDLEPGRAAFSTHFKRYGYVNVMDGGFTSLARLFDGKSNNAGFRIFNSTVAGQANSGIIPQEDKPESWHVITMRLADGAGEASSWDYSDYYGLMGTEDTRQYNIKTSALYGSANGANWEQLAVAADVPMRDNYGRWAFDGRTVSAHTNCNTIASRVAQNAYPFLNNMAGSVSVAPGAVLVCEGAPIAFSKIKLDAAGSGSIRGATFTEAGEISVENVTMNGEIVFAGLFDDCDATANIGTWVLRENGEITARRKAIVRGSDLRIVCKGFCVSIR
jgi:autotransporter-associated beta strand protein